MFLPRYALRLLVALAFVALPANAQVVQVSAGASTIFPSEGAEATVYRGQSTSSLGLGIIGGHFVAGFDTRMPFRGWMLNAGDQGVAFPLATDFNSYGAQIFARGVSLSRKRKNSDLLILIGSENQTFSTSYVYGSIGKLNPVGLLFYSRDYGKLKLSTHIVAGSRSTALESVEYSSRGITLAGSAGAGSNTPYGAGLFDLHKKSFQTRITYAAGKSFQRIVTPNLLLSENTGLNASADITPWKNLRLSASHQSLAAVEQSGIQTTSLNTAAMTLSAGHFNFHASEFLSDSKINRVSGTSAGMGATWQRIATQTEFFHTKYGEAVSTSISEMIWRRFHLMEFVNESAGRPSFSIGGSYTSNRLSLSVSQQMQFIPLSFGSNPFRRILALSITLHIHGAALNLSTSADATGRVRLTSFGQDYFGDSLGGHSNQTARSIEGFVVSGIVVDTDGAPVEGAVIQIGNQTVFSSADGKFQARFKSRGIHDVRVLTDEFVSGEWIVISAPTTASTGDALKILVDLKKEE